MYDPKSMKAEEFIDHEEVMASLAYGEANKDNMELIDSILEKAKLRKGLNHRDAAVLMACEDPKKLEEFYALAHQIKLDFYGNRIVMFAPLYLSNYCVNGCVYCPYHHQNGHIPRVKLTQEQVRDEVIALQDMGHKRLAIECGEDPVNNPIEYVLDCIKTIYSIKHKNGAIRRVNVNIAATTVENYRKLHEAGYQLNPHDFCAKREEMEQLHLGEVYDDIYEACGNSRLLLILNNHKKYFDLQENDAILSNRDGFAVLDSWGVCQNLKYNENIDLYNLGNIMIK